METPNMARSQSSEMSDFPAPTVADVETVQSIDRLLWKLRNEDPTQYTTLIKMHLAFATDLPTDQCDCRSADQSTNKSRWQLTPLIRRLGRSSSSKGVMEGAPLTQEGVCQAFQLINFLNKDYNIGQEGLFRKSGSLTRQQELKLILNAGGDINLDSGTYSAHDCASVLKGFLADLPEPLLTETHYGVHCRIAEMVKHYMSADQQVLARSRQVKALRLVFLLLPQENFQLLRDLLLFLHQVAEKESENKMSSKNLGTMFAPHILCPRKMTPSDMQHFSETLSNAVAFMIENAKQMFQIPLELEYDVRQYWKNKRKLKHQLSKRSMMDAPTTTVFSFVDRDLSSKANNHHVTDVALAELYAYVQALPDSARRRKLIRQFNDASGTGTPIMKGEMRKAQDGSKGKTIGDCIRRHLFQKGGKGAKSKSQPFMSVGSMRVKRTSSDDLLLSTVSPPSPQLRSFRRNGDTGTTEHTRAKSLDDLTSDDPTDRAQGGLLSPTLPPSIAHPAFHPQMDLLGYNSRLPRPINLSMDSFETLDSSENGSPLSPIAPTSMDDTVDSIGDSVFRYPLPNHFVSTPSDPCQEESPISLAVHRAGIAQQVMMTPRSRCPIVVNSTTSLTGIATTITMEDESPVIVNHAAQMESPVRAVEQLPSNNSATGEWEEVGVMGEVVKKGRGWHSTSSLFGNFFRHLSTSSLTQLASKLTSINNRSLQEVSEAATAEDDKDLVKRRKTQLDDDLGNVFEEDLEEDPDSSLSSVFKDYLFNRTLLTDNPVNLSTDKIDYSATEATDDCQIATEPDFWMARSCPDSAYGSTVTCFMSRDSSKASVGDSGEQFSDSLLYCLDGHNPFDSQTEVSNGTKVLADSIQVGIDSLTNITIEGKKKQELLSCSPNSRQHSVLQSKQGTPVRLREKETTEATTESHSIVFETSF